MSGDVPGGCSGVQSYLRRALARAVSADTFGAFIRGRVNLLQLQQELARRHCDPPRARGSLSRRIPHPASRITDHSASGIRHQMSRCHSVTASQHVGLCTQSGEGEWVLAGLGQKANYGEAEVGKIGGCFADVAAAAAAEESGIPRASRRSRRLYPRGKGVRASGCLLDWVKRQTTVRQKSARSADASPASPPPPQPKNPASVTPFTAFVPEGGEAEAGLRLKRNRPQRCVPTRIHPWATRSHVWVATGSHSRRPRGSCAHSLAPRSSLAAQRWAQP
eukprot:scaffold4569_cov117-Isochrysis_galbana.AAC.4